jgi:hypothetical protein
VEQVKNLRDAVLRNRSILIEDNKTETSEMKNRISLMKQRSSLGSKQRRGSQVANAIAAMSFVELQASGLVQKSIPWYIIMDSVAIKYWNALILWLVVYCSAYLPLEVAFFRGKPISPVFGNFPYQCAIFQHLSDLCSP